MASVSIVYRHTLDLWFNYSILQDLYNSCLSTAHRMRSRTRLALRNQSDHVYTAYIVQSDLSHSENHDANIYFNERLLSG